MKKSLISLALAALVLTACNGGRGVQIPSDSTPTKAQQLAERLDSLRQKGYMFGHQDDTMYGLTWA